MSLISQLVSLATKTLSGKSGNRSGYGRQTSSRNQLVQKIGSQAIDQVRKAGPDAAQRHLSKTRFGTDPRARKAASVADSLARRFAGPSDRSDGDRSADRPGGRR